MKFFIQVVVGKRAREAFKAAGLEWPDKGVAWGVYRRDVDDRVYHVGKYHVSREDADAALVVAEKHWKENKLNAPVKASSFPRLRRKKK